jgi:hypothetical protein
VVENLHHDLSKSNNLLGYDLGDSKGCPVPKGGKTS